MTAWNGPLVGSDSLDIDHILYGKGSFCKRERSPDTKRPRILRELIEFYRLVGSNRETEVGTPPPKVYDPVGSLDWTH